ncbi:MAG: four-carbon acid sugar kinase family protein, partial [Deinococcota bacterium]|nr:four-carbon acid sugar kinase family protein [Deinococcota bacterium]
MSEMSRAVLRLLADDLTGALDSAAPFVKLCGPIGAHWRLPADPLSPSAAISLGTRDEATPLARARFEAAGGIFKGADLAFHKIDSLLRGHPALEIDIACRQGFSLVIVAPAFPAQGRLTRGGLQRFASGDPVPRERVNPLGRQLQELGHELTFVAHPQGLTKASRGIVLCDAESDEALEDIA